MQNCPFTGVGATESGSPLPCPPVTGAAGPSPRGPRLRRGALEPAGLGASGSGDVRVQGRSPVAVTLTYVGPRPGVGCARGKGGPRPCARTGRLGGGEPGPSPRAPLARRTRPWEGGSFPSFRNIPELIQPPKNTWPSHGRGPEKGVNLRSREVKLRTQQDPNFDGPCHFCRGRGGEASLHRVSERVSEIPAVWPPKHAAGWPKCGKSGLEYEKTGLKRKISV